MKKIENKVNKILDHWKLFTGVITIIITIIGVMWGVFSSFQDLKDNNEEILNTLQTTQQMALKSVIWNDNIPGAERAKACDVYLNAGYNSLTKKECEVIIEKEASKGLFSYVGR